MHICFSTHCIVLFPLRTPESWLSAKCTRRLFKVWRNWPNSKLICYSERGEPKLSFEYKFVGHTWKLLKLYPTVHAYLFFYTLYCIVSTENTGKLKQNWYVIKTQSQETNIVFFLDNAKESGLKDKIDMLLKPNHKKQILFSSW